MKYNLSGKSDHKSENYENKLGWAGCYRVLTKEEAVLLFEKNSFCNNTANPIKTVVFPKEKLLDSYHFSLMFLDGNKRANFYYIKVTGELRRPDGEVCSSARGGYSRENNIMYVREVRIYPITTRKTLRCYIEDEILTKKLEYNGKHHWTVNEVIVE